MLAGALLCAPSSPHTQAVCAVSLPAPQWNTDTTFHAPPRSLASGAVTSDWSSFLGPTHNMQSPETKLLQTFAPGEPHCVWEMKKGAGYGAPAVSGERLVLFHRLADDEAIDCLNAQDGRQYWRFSYPTHYRDRYGYDNGPRCAPVIANDLVFLFGAEGELHCLDLKTGQLRWHRSIQREFKLKPNFFGVGATPLVVDSNLIVNVGAEDGPCVAAFDTATGRLVWGSGRDWGMSYASPVPAVWHGQRRVLVFAGGESRPPSGGLLCLNPADGRVDWTFSWRGKPYESVNASTPVVIGNQIFVSESYGAGGALIAAGTNAGYQLVWSNMALRTHFMTAVTKDGYLYGADGHGPGNTLVCVEVQSGREIWRARPQWGDGGDQIGAAAHVLEHSPSRCSFLLVDGGCLCLGEFGHLAWLDLSPNGYRERCRVRLFAGHDTWTAPVLSRGLLYVCQNTRDALTGVLPRLCCYDLRAAE